MTLQHAFEQAVRHHGAGQLGEAEALCRQILRYQPDHADALHMLGVLAGQAGRHAEAIELVRRAVRLNPSAAEAWNNLGALLAAAGQTDDAIAAFRQALACNPNLPEACNGLGNALLAAGRTDEALAAYRQAIALRPRYPEALNNLSNALRLKGELPEAIAAAREALAARPEFPEAHNNLGTALQMNGQVEEAVAAYLRALALRPDYPDALYNLGAARQACGRLEDAVAAYRAVLGLRPDYAEAYGNLGNVLEEMGRTDEAMDAYRRAIAINPRCRAADNLLLALHFHPDWGPREIFQEHARWNRAYAEPLAPSIRPHENDPSPDRRLRVGYVSPDFTVHPVGRFLLPLLAHRERAAAEIHCYSDVRKPDGMTQRLRDNADVWHDAASLSDGQLADQIRQDRIDILVDLTLHAEGSRLLAFARKPAPVQVTYLAYCSTSGLRTMDYRLSDPYLDPSGGDESVYSEQTVRLPRTYWCYDPPASACASASAVGPLPAISAAEGHVTFGCFNNYSKVSHPTLLTWLELLRRAPNSRLLIYSRLEGARHPALALAERGGIDPRRIQIVGPVPTPEYFRRYRTIDIALDPFPYGGGTTTCDALWMGVPVVSLAGRTAVSRAGLSILSNVGLPELVARTTDQYVQIASALAADLPGLTKLRKTLRERMRASPLMDAPGFARDVEAAFRTMWRNWCASVTATR